MEFIWISDHEEPLSMKAFLKRQGVSRKFLTHAKFHGQITLNGEWVTVRASVKKGDRVGLIVEDEEGHETVRPSYEDIPIVYEDRDLLVVNKPAGISSLPSKAHPDRSLANRIRGYYMKNNYSDQVIHVVTRLDKCTSGVVLVAKHRFAHALLDQALGHSAIHKRYFAIAYDPHHILKAHDQINRPIGRKPGSIIERQVMPEGKISLTEYWLKKRLGDYALLSLQLHTGRTHQIRVHLQSLGCPLLGDDLYGGPLAYGLERQALHCQQLSLTHPFTGDPLIVETPLAEDLSEALVRLKADQDKG
ncbi:RluA family pseudouridine synthase [Atopobacter sp. AH10]|uniref:RluA family pseudouridine synthase n=1 Tax=Atopobacter sp. AH10 TaxID=2315861 RepID=UPI000EF1DF3B|nr:RluA family pseudouridine synthase [Atopobacter sp. AH10]RLK64201.1 RluA family pseudouridine synthase [Atopobacter sp. AH10]